MLGFLNNNLTFLLIMAGLVGLIVGSFLNVVIHRLPIMLDKQYRLHCQELLNLPQQKSDKQYNLWLPRSHCPQCKATISAWANIPLLSYLFLKGKCKHCHYKISLRYPLVELLSCVLTLFTFYHFGFSPYAIAACIFTWSLLALVFIDIEQQILPDQITLPLLWLGLLLSLVHLFTNPQNAILGAVIGYLSLWIIAKLFKLIRGIEGIGYGDFKLTAMFGAWLGWQTLPLIVLIAAVSGSIVGIILMRVKKYTQQTPIPFGPFLAIAGWIALFWGQNIIQWYMNVSF